MNLPIPDKAEAPAPAGSAVTPAESPTLTKPKATGPFVSIVGTFVALLSGAAATGLVLCAFEIGGRATDALLGVHPLLPAAIAGLAGVLAAMIVALSSPTPTKHDKVSLRISDLLWTRNDFCRGWYVSGTTGSGKTEALKLLMHLLLRQEKDMGGLFIDEKGFFIEEVLPILNTYDRGKDIRELRIRRTEDPASWKPPFSFNILGDQRVRTSQYVDAILTVAEAVASNQNDKGFFKTQAGLHIGAAIDLYRGLREWQRLRGMDATQLVAPTLRGVYRILTSEEDFRELVMVRVPLFVERETANTVAGPRGEVSKKKTIVPEYQGVTPALLLQAVDHFQKRYWTIKAQDQMEGVKGTITNYLKWFADDAIDEVFGDERGNFTIRSIDDGAMICLSLPQEYAIERRYLCSMMKVLAYAHARSRLPLKRNYNLGVIWQDEAGRFIMPVDGDVEILRQYQFTTVIVTQFRVQLEKGLGNKVQADSVLGNLRNRVILQAADEHCAKESADFIGKGVRRKRSYTYQPNGKRSMNVSEEVAYLIEPYQLRNLPKFCAVFCHANGRHRLLQFTPLTDLGIVPDWFRALAVPAMRWRLKSGMKGPVFVKVKPPKVRIAG